MSEEIAQDVTVDELLDVATGGVQEAEHPAGIQMAEWCFSNDKTNPHIRQLFHMFYNSVFANKLGLMHARVKGTEDVETILVGVEVRPDGGMLTYPLAKLLTPDEQNQYEAPDGNGGYIQANPDSDSN
jgi:hypothetical protein